MKLAPIVLVMAGAALIIAGLLTAPAYTVDLGGCFGKTYECVPAKVDVQVNYADGAPMNNAHVELWYRVGAGWSTKAVQTDSTGHITFQSVPVNLRVSPLYSDYYGEVRVPLGGGLVHPWWYEWDNVSKTASYSPNHIAGDAYSIVIGGSGESPTEPPPDTIDIPSKEGVTNQTTPDTTPDDGGDMAGFPCSFLLIALGIVFIVLAILVVRK